MVAAIPPEFSGLLYVGLYSKKVFAAAEKEQHFFCQGFLQETV